MSKKSAHNASEAGQIRLIEASVEIVKTARFVRSLAFVVPPDINDGQVRQVVHHVLIEQGHGLELTKEAAEGIVLCEHGRDEIVTIQPAEPDTHHPLVVLRADRSGSIFFKRDGSWGWEAFGS
jgi:hypothetical protein